MNQTSTFGYEDDLIKTAVYGGVGVVEMKCNVYGAITDLAESGKLLSFFHAAEMDPHIHALLLASRCACYTSTEFDRFVARIKPCAKDGAPSTPEDAHLRNERHRYAHVLNRVVMHLAEFKKICAVTLMGEVVTPFFGASLAADFRYATPDMIFVPAHIRHGLFPGGALPFFLPHHVGRGRATEILFGSEGLTAKEALELGLITAILPKDDFVGCCVDELRRYSELPMQTILNSKMLLAYTLADLKKYFDREAALQI